MGSGSIMYIVRVLTIISSWTCANDLSFFLICSFSYLIKKASKTRKDMQGIHEGTGAMLLPTLLAAAPSSIPVLLCMPQPKFSSMYPLHCHVLPLSALPFFLSNCLTHRHSLIKVLLLSHREVNSNYWGDFFTWMCLCLFPSLCTGSGVILLFFLLFRIVCFL